MADRPSPETLDLDAPEHAVGPEIRATINGLCPVCEFSFTRNRTMVVFTSWSRIVHPSCLADPWGNPVHPRHRLTRRR
jgi:hypothetical protein